jgi:hypothetical protein
MQIIGEVRTSYLKDVAGLGKRHRLNNTLRLVSVDGICKRNLTNEAYLTQGSIITRLSELLNYTKLQWVV